MSSLLDLSPSKLMNMLLVAAVGREAEGAASSERRDPFRVVPSNGF